MGLLDDIKGTVGGAVAGAAGDENIKKQVKTTVTDAATKVTGDKVDKKVVSNTVNTAVDEAAKLAKDKLGK